MATKYVTLKDSNGDTLYPQAVATNLAPGSIDTTEIADGAVTTAKIADGTIATGDIANNAVTAAKINWTTASANKFAIPVTSGYPYDASGKYAKMLRLDFTSNWKSVAIRFTLAATQADSFIYDVLLYVRRDSNAVGAVTLTAWKLKSTIFDLAANLKLVAVSSTQFELYLYLPVTVYSPMLTVYSLTSYDPRYAQFGELTMYENVAVSTLPAGTQYSCTVKNNLIS